MAAFSAIKGYIAGREDFDENVDLNIEMPEEFLVNDNMIISPAVNYKDIEVIRGPNIKPFPKNKSLEDITGGKVLIKVGDDVTTDAIMPSNAKLLPYRSNIPYLSEFCFSLIDKDFPQRARKTGRSHTCREKLRPRLKQRACCPGPCI